MTPAKQTACDHDYCFTFHIQLDNLQIDTESSYHASDKHFIHIKKQTKLMLTSYRCKFYIWVNSWKTNNPKRSSFHPWNGTYFSNWGSKPIISISMRKSLFTTFNIKSQSTRCRENKNTQNTYRASCQKSQCKSYQPSNKTQSSIHNTTSTIHQTPMIRNKCKLNFQHKPSHGFHI